MNIAMFANAYKPVVGGLERSVATFAEDLRRMGHRVLIVTLAFPGAEGSEETVFRLPSVKKVGGTQFSVKLPVPTKLKQRLDSFKPDIVHSHHPFMLGDTALRVARRRGLRLVFTHHTLYERYAYLFSEESEMLASIAKAIATEYGNLCDLVVAPTASIKHMIRERGVKAPIEIIPTGVDLELYENGDGAAFRRRHKLPEEAFVLGYLGRVVEAKNMRFLARAGARFLQQKPEAWFLIVGDGESVQPVKRCFEEAGVMDRAVMTGSMEDPAVADAYAAMDLFAFASKTDTQGIVLVESFCAGVPIVALDATGARDIVRDGEDGCLLEHDATPEQFADALMRVHDDGDLRARWSRAAQSRAREFSRERCAGRLGDVYDRLVGEAPRDQTRADQFWPSLQERFSAEWDLFKEKLNVIASAVSKYENHG